MATATGRADTAQAVHTRRRSPVGVYCIGLDLVMTPAQLNLKAALKATDEQDRGLPISPLSEADPKSLDILFERVTAKLVQGLPEAITDEDLGPVIAAIRAKRDLFLVEQARKDSEEKPKRGSRGKAAAPAMDLLEITDLSEL